MPPWTNLPLSPSELSYLHTSLTLTPPIRPDARPSPTHFRPLVAESDILPNTNGSARICFADGSEAVVGVKAEVEPLLPSAPLSSTALEVSVEIPGFRDDDALPVFLSEMLREAIVADGAWGRRRGINARFRWRVFVDILLLSQPLSYPLPLLSLTTHLALRSTRLPALVSKGDEDPLFNDDWAASVPLYDGAAGERPPVTLLVMSVGENVLFDPSRDELAVADAVVAISVAGEGRGKGGQEGLKVVAVRMVDPPSRLTTAGTLDAGAGAGERMEEEALAARELDGGKSVWRPSRGGLRRDVLGRMIEETVKKGGVGEEIMEALMGVTS